MDFSIWQLILTILGLLLTAWGTAKVVFGRIIKAADEIEDVITLTAGVAKESADVLNAVVAAGMPDEDGSIRITQEELEKIKTEAAEVKEKAEQLPKEVNEAWTAMKNIFKKQKEE